MKLDDGSIDYVFKLGDFGISRTFVTGDGVTPIPHSPNYQDPWLAGDNYDHKVDLYSLGFLMMVLEGHHLNPNATLDPQFKSLHQNLMSAPERRHNIETILNIARSRSEEMVESPVPTIIESIISGRPERTDFNFIGI